MVYARNISSRFFRNFEAIYFEEILKKWTNGCMKIVTTFYSLQMVNMYVYFWNYRKLNPCNEIWTVHIKYASFHNTVKSRVTGVKAYLCEMSNLSWGMRRIYRLQSIKGLILIFDEINHYPTKRDVCPTLWN